MKDREHRVGWLIGLMVVIIIAPASVAARDQIEPNDEGAPDDRLRDLSASVEATGALGMYRDRRTDEMVVVVPESGSSTFDARLHDPSIRIRVETQPLERSSIAAIKDRALSVATTPDAVPGGFSAFFDPRRGKVVVISSAPRDTFADLLADHPNLVEYQFGRPTLHSRWSDSEPHWGGATMEFSASTCTSGFAVNNWNMNPRMVTAAHCGSLGDYATSPGTGVSFGTVKVRDNYPDNDFMLVGDNSIGQQGRIYVTENSDLTHTSMGVNSANDTVEGFDDYCISGSIDGGAFVSCGYEVVDETVNFCPHDQDGDWDYPGDHCNANTVLYCGTPGTVYGDSGAPFYVETTSNPVRAAIRGIAIGYNDFVTGDPNLPLNCGWMERWPEISSEYNVTIKTNLN
ncbi:MAG TPA: hypothetical protein VMZ33_04195 [Candidatus Limnocylindrales bacterium]|nr:hypothetical protein [Candidatus Limnocylindrales bacterium]